MIFSRPIQDANATLSKEVPFQRPTPAQMRPAKPGHRGLRGSRPVRRPLARPLPGLSLVLEAFAACGTPGFDGSTVLRLCDAAFEGQVSWSVAGAPTTVIDGNRTEPPRVFRRPDSGCTRDGVGFGKSGTSFPVILAPGSWSVWGEGFSFLLWWRVR